MNQVNNYQGHAITVIENLIATKGIFTAYHVTTILRKCGFQVPHNDIRHILEKYDIATKGYDKTLTVTGVFKVQAFIYHPKNVPQQELLDFENALAEKIKDGKDNSPIPSTLATPKVQPAKAPVVAPTPAPANTPVVTAVKTPGVVSSIRLKANDPIKVKADARNRICIPASIVRKYFTKGDKVGIVVENCHITISKFNNGKKYNSVLTVDSYDNIRFNADLMPNSAGNVTVNFNDILREIVLT